MSATLIVAIIGWVVAACMTVAWWRAVDLMHWAQADAWAIRRWAREAGVEPPGHWPL